MKTHYYSATNCVTTEYHRGPQPQASTWTNSHQFSPSVKAFPLPSSDIRWKQGIKTPQSRKNTDEIRFKRPSWKRANTHSHQRDLSTPANNLTFSCFSCSVTTAGSSACLIRQFYCSLLVGIGVFSRNWTCDTSSEPLRWGALQINVTHQTNWFNWANETSKNIITYFLHADTSTVK